MHANETPDNEFSVVHRYWIWGNRMREHCCAALDRDKRPRDGSDLSWFADDIGMFMSYWYAGLYVIIEGWKELVLHDPKIDPLLDSPHVEELRRYRNGVCHFQKKYLDDRFMEICHQSPSSVPWVRKLTRTFGEYFLRTLRSNRGKA